MLQCMDRSLTHHLKQKGYTNTQIAKVIGCHRDSVARVLRESPDKQPAQRERPSQVAVFHDQIQTWLNQNFSVKRMIERARADADHPYQGRDPAFYAYVRPLRRKRRALDSEATVRFEGLPGELLQIDWGEVRRMPFTQACVGGSDPLLLCRPTETQPVDVCPIYPRHARGNPDPVLDRLLCRTRRCALGRHDR